MTKRGIVDLPYLDFLVDLDAVQFTPKLQSQIDDHITAVGGAAFQEDDWEKLRFTLAVYVATQQARLTQPMNKSAKLSSLQKSAKKHLAWLDKFDTEEVDSLLGDIFPEEVRAEYLKQLRRFAGNAKEPLDFGDPALELDKSLRELFTKVAKARPTISHSAAVSDSPYQIFLKIVFGAIPDGLLPPDTGKTLSTRPQALESQRAKQREEAAALSAKFTRVGQSAKLRRESTILKAQLGDEPGSKGNDSYFRNT